MPENGKEIITTIHCRPWAALQTKEIDHEQTKNNELFWKRQTGEEPGSKRRRATGCRRRVAPDRGRRTPSTYYKPGRFAFRQSKLTSGQFARSYASGGFCSS